MQADGAPFGLCVSKGKGRPGLNGLFTDEGLEDMLEAAAIKNFYMMSPFIGVLLDLICGE